MIAVDTNILAYAQGEADPLGRHLSAASLMKKLVPIDAIIPVQVLGEFMNVCIRKFGLAPTDAMAQVEDYRLIFRCPVTQTEDIVEAAALLGCHNLAYFDALIVTVAARAGATMLLSEDMQDGLEIGGVRIVNPFVTDNEAMLVDYIDSAS